MTEMQKYLNYAVLCSCLICNGRQTMCRWSLNCSSILHTCQKLDKLSVPPHQTYGLCAITWVCKNYMDFLKALFSSSTYSYKIMENNIISNLNCADDRFMYHQATVVQYKHLASAFNKSMTSSKTKMKQIIFYGPNKSFYIILCAFFITVLNAFVLCKAL